MEIETERLVLRTLAAADADDLMALWSDPDVVRYIGSGLPVEDRDWLAPYLTRVADHWARHRLGMWAVTRKADGRFLGRGGLQPLVMDGRTEIEVGYMFAKAYWGQGYATEMARASLRYGFETRSLTRIIAIARPENAASRHVLEKAGLLYERTSPWRGGGEIVYYALAREAYRPDAAPYRLRPDAPVNPI